MAGPRTEIESPDGGRTSEDPASKSQRKREAHAIKSLATELLGLSAAELQRIPLSNDIQLAIEEARKLRSHGARRRQLQYIAKLVRRVDSPIIIAALAEIKSEARGLTARQHRVEAWRETLIARGDGALQELLQQHVAADVQSLRRLIRSAQNERNTGRPPGAARALFRALRDLDAKQALPPCQ